MNYLIIDKRQRAKCEGEYPYAVRRIVEEIEKKHAKHHVGFFDQIDFLFKDGATTITVNGKDIRDFSHIIFRGHSLGDHRQYETKRMIVNYIEHVTKTQNSITKIQNSNSIRNLPYYNKIYLAQYCAQNLLPHFHTFYKTNGNYSVKLTPIGFPWILKEYAGENDVRQINGEEKVKKNVYKIDKLEDLKQENLNNKDLSKFFIEEFSPVGEDMRVFVSKGKIVGAWKRKATKGFMTVSNGKYSLYTPNPEVEKIAIKIADLLQADFMAVDFMYKDGMPYIQEISLHPGFKAFETKIAGNTINIAKTIVESF